MNILKALTSTDKITLDRNKSKRRFMYQPFNWD